MLKHALSGGRPADVARTDEKYLMHDR
jgi:hypothetical protein